LPVVISCYTWLLKIHCSLILIISGKTIFNQVIFKFEYQYKKIDSILDYISQHAQKRAGGKTAILISKDLEYGMSRMVPALSELKGIPVKLEVFRSLAEAEHWLAEEN
jgi:hypothetical protein